MSDDTIKDIAVLKTQMEQQQKSLEKIDKKVDDGFLHIEEVIKEALNGKANKWVETLAKMVVGIIIASFVGGLVFLLWHITPILP